MQMRVYNMLQDYSTNILRRSTGYSSERFPIHFLQFVKYIMYIHVQRVARTNTQNILSCLVVRWHIYTIFWLLAEASLLWFNRKNEPAAVIKSFWDGVLFMRRKYLRSSLQCSNLICWYNRSLLFQLSSFFSFLFNL